MLFGKPSQSNAGPAGDNDGERFAAAQRTTRRLLALHAIVSSILLPEVKPVLVIFLVLLGLMEIVLPAHRFVKERAFQDVIASICYLTLPVFAVIYLANGTNNALLDSLLSFLILFQLKWIWAPRGDFHYLGAVLLIAMLGMRYGGPLYAVVFIVFVVLSILYLATRQEQFYALPVERSASYSANKKAPLARQEKGYLGIKLQWALPFIFAFAIVLFFLAPRNPNPWQIGSGKFTHVSDSVSLGNPGPLTLDPKVVAELEVTKGTIDPRRTYLRTGHLDEIDETGTQFTWSQDSRSDSPAYVEVPYRNRLGGAIEPNSRVYRQTFRRRSVDPERRLEYRMTIFDPLADFVAVPAGTFEIGLYPAGRIENSGGDFYKYKGLRPLFRVAGTAAQPVYRARAWRVMPYHRPFYLSLPERRRLTFVPPGLSRPEFISLAKRWSGNYDERETLRRAATVIESLQNSGAKYSTNPRMRPGGLVPIYDFLFVDPYREGYCEIFASSAVVLLRHLNIPARVAVGFQGLEPTDDPNRFLLRRNRAHAWVEVFVREHGWVAFDPTPRGALADATRNGIGTTNEIPTWQQELARAWQRGVMNFDYLEQARIYYYAQRGIARVSYHVSDFFETLWSSRTDEEGTAQRRTAWIRLLEAIGVILLALAGALIVLQFSRNRGAASKQVNPFWRQIEKKIAADLGRKRRPYETARDYCRSAVEGSIFSNDTARNILSYIEKTDFRREPASKTIEKELLNW